MPEKTGLIWKNPPFLSSSNAAKMLGESKFGKHIKSMEPFKATRATVLRSPIIP
jgi:hypothetical protein